MNLFYQVLEDFDNITYPKNDIDAYKLYPNFANVYNKLEIAKIQGLECNPFPIYPNKFPIISKPIINLNGMGLGAKKIKNKREFYKDIESTNFWCEFLEGDHYSWDLILRNGKIIYSTSFYGKKWKFGTFKYWKEETNKLPDNIYLIIDKYLNNFTGSVNMETIGNKVIEVHLRMGDIDLTDKDIIYLALINIQKDTQEELINKQLEKIRLKEIKKINLIPIWEKKFINFELIGEEKYKIIKKNIVPLLQNDDKIIDYYIDSMNHPDPEGYKRWFLLLTYDLDYGLKLGKKLEKIIKNLSLDNNQLYH